MPWPTWQDISRAIDAQEQAAFWSFTANFHRIGGSFDRATQAQNKSAEYAALARNRMYINTTEV